MLDTDADFDRPVASNGQLEATAHGAMERLLRYTGVGAGLLFNGTALRLVSAPRGESSGWVDFRVADMEQTGGRRLAAAMRLMRLLLGQDRLLAGRRKDDWPHSWRRAGSEEECRQRWPELLAIVEHRVKPARVESGRKSKSAHGGRAGVWWQHYHKAKELYNATAGLERVCAALMVRHDEGLTKTYNRFHDPYQRDAEVAELRELHAAMDRAVLAAYGWSDIPTDCDFFLDYEIDEAEWRRKKKPYRFPWLDRVRDEVLARLLELNAKRAEQEARSGAVARRAAAGRSTKPLRR